MQNQTQLKLLNSMNELGTIQKNQNEKIPK